MFDIKWIRENPEAFDKEMARRGIGPQTPFLLEKDAKRRVLQTEIQELNEARNRIARLLGEAKQKGQDATALIEEGAQLKKILPEKEQEEKELAAEIEAVLVRLPNILLAEVPDGPDESANKEILKWGNIPSFSFTPKEHYEVGEALGLMNFEEAAYLSGSRFVVLKGDLARLERVLAQFMLDTHTQKFGYQEVSPPYLVRDAAVFGVGQLPKFEEDLFKTTTGHWLISTGEVPLTNLVAEKILEEEVLPLRFTAYTPCFRSEAGAAGKDTRGMLRQHQFGKVELVSIVHPEKTKEEHERMAEASQEILKQLNLPYRVMLLSTGDTGPASQKTYDLEVWLPGQKEYREISSCSQCGDYQARRMNARFRPKELADKKKIQFVHTLNGSGLAVGRTLIAILENYQKADGSVEIPSVLQPYFGGRKEIKAYARPC